MDFFRHLPESLDAMKGPTSRFRAITYRIALAALFILLAGAGASSSILPQTPAERTMLRQIASGHEVDLTPAPEKGKMIRASFLWDLLTSEGTRLEGNKITIIGAVVE